MREMEKERRRKVISNRGEEIGEERGEGYRKGEKRDEGGGGEEEGGKERVRVCVSEVRM